MIKLTDPAGPNRDAVLAMLRNICPEGNLRVDPDGTVVIQSAAACRDPAAGCRCICHMVSFSGDTNISIAHDLSAFGGGVTTPANPADCVRTADGHMGRGSTANVQVENRSRYQVRDMSVPPVWVDEPDWMILAHELCGHAIHDRRGDHPKWMPPAPDPDWHRQSQDATAEIRAARGLPPVDETDTRVRPGA